MGDADHTNLLNSLEEVQQGIHQLATAADAGVMAGLVAHEVRNLLTPAVAYAQLARSDPRATPDELRCVLDRALVAMRRACEVSELILAHVRETSDRSASVAQVADVVIDCVRSLGWDRLTSNGPFTVGVEVPPCSVAIAPDALRHVILNLLLNARSALPNRGGRIQVGATWNRDTVAITVSDNGRGIEATKLQRIKSDLTRTTKAAPQRHGGLGLVLCDRLLAASGARLMIESSEGAGTTATVAIRAAA